MQEAGGQGLQGKTISLLIPEAPLDFRQPTLKRLQEETDWNHQPHSNVLSAPKPKPKPGTKKVKTEEANTNPDPSPIPSTSSGGVTELDPKIKDALVKKLSKRGRGRGSRKGEQLSISSSRRNRRQFRCSYCEYASVRRYNTERHIRLRHPNYRYKCPLEQCGQILLDEAELRIHLQGHSTAAFFLQCHDCGIMCGDYDSLLSHQNMCPAIQSSVVVGGAILQRLGQVDAGGNRGDQDGSGGIQDMDHARGGAENERIVVHLNEATCEQVEEQGEEQSQIDRGPGEGNDDDDNDSIEIVDDDNLPVHFMVKEEQEKEEVRGSPDSSS